MKCEIIWNKLTVAEWEKRFDRVKRSNILQDYSYAKACRKLNRQSARWGLVVIDDVEAGIVQIIEAGFLFNFFHGVIVDRGPLWFDGYGGAAHIAAFFQEFNKIFPKRIGRKRRVIPEVENGLTIENILKQSGFGVVPTTQKYQTLWWNLNEDEEAARANLKNNWHGALKKAEQKAEKSELTITWDDKGKDYSWLRHVYEEDKKNKGYSGISPKLLDNLALFSTLKNPMIIGKVTKEGRDIAAMLFLTHGQSATYQIGWSSDEGRKYCAHHLLLWRARSMLRSRGIYDLDLGGINNDETAKGIRKFKQGTGALASTLVGHYC